MGGHAVLIRALAALYPYEVEASDELVDSVSFIEADYDPETIVRAGFGAGIVAAVLLLPIFLLPASVFSLVFLWLVGVVLVITLVQKLPTILAAFRRTTALGDTPNLIGRAVLRMKIQPATETAVRFAADSGTGPLSDSLKGHIDRSMGTPRSGLITFAEEWSEHFPALRRSAYLLATAENAPENERARTLDRALQAVLDGTRNRMAEFTARIQGPSTALYAFGVMVPLALIALVPAAAIVGIPISIWVFLLLYNGVLPVILLAASVWLLVRRPVAFPPPEVTRNHPDVPDRNWLSLVAGGAVGVLAFVVVLLFGPSYLAPVAGVGLAIGTGLFLFYRPIAIVREYVRNVEEHLSDAMYLIGRQVSEGEAVEAAIELAGRRVPGETGEIFEQAGGIQRRLHVDVEDAFLGEYGALRNVPSPRAHSTASLLAIAAAEGRPAGRAIVAMADHLEELQEVENETRRRLTTVTGTLENTASYFGPMVAGATVAMADGMVEEGLEAADANLLPTDQLGIVVGVYVILLCLILTPLSVALRHGLDRPLVGYYVGRSLLFAMPLYVMTVMAVGLIFGSDSGFDVGIGWIVPPL